MWTCGEPWVGEFPHHHDNYDEWDEKLILYIFEIQRISDCKKIFYRMGPRY